MNQIYLDNNATTPLHPYALEAMLPYLQDKYGNASSIYKFGQEARKAIEDARETMAEFIGADDPSEIIFTSCATESNNLVLKGVPEAHLKKGRRVVSSSIEHSAVRNVLTYLSEKNWIDFVPVAVNKDGLVLIDEIEAATTADTVLVSIMAVNNETGAIQPIKKISSICQNKGIPFHTDAVQAAAKIPIMVNEWGVDLLSLSAHKFNGPKGVGILYVRKGTRCEALLHGGSHEKNRRAGTENVAGIVGMAKAAQIAMTHIDQKNLKLKNRRDELEEGILKEIPQTFVNAGNADRVSNTTNICFEFTDSSSLIMALDLKGVTCSNGSACATGSVEASHVLLAMGLPQDKAHASIRFSLGADITEADVNKTISIVKNCVAKIRDTHPMWSNVNV